MHNARLSERTTFLGQVDVVPHNSNRVLRVWGQDVSETGMFLQTTQPFTVGDTVSLRFDVEQNEVHVRAAEVMWVRKFEPIAVDGKLPGIGLRFVSVDPPARAAIRRLAPALKATPERDTLIEPANVVATSGPPAKAAAPKPKTKTQPLPAPKITLPPLTESIIARAQGITPKKRSSTTEVGISLAPFSDLPAISLPPDDPQLSSAARVFEGIPAGPRDVTMAPQPRHPRTTQPLFMGVDDGEDDFDVRADDDESNDDNAEVEAFVGWTFRRVDAMPEAPIEAAPRELSQRFDDDAPDSMQATTRPSIIVEPSILEDAEAANDDFSLGALPVEFDDGAIAIRQLSLIEERAPAPLSQSKKPNRSVATAVAFLVAGCAAGAVVGLAPRFKASLATPKAPVAALEPLDTATVTPTPAPVVTAPVLDVAAAEAGLFDDKAKAKPEPKVEAKPEVKAEKLAEAKPASTKSEEPALAPLEKAAKKDPKKKDSSSEKPTLLASTTKPSKKEALEASPGHLEVQLAKGGKVKRAFALSNPSRVVVDLVGADLPKKPLDVDEGGVMQLRFGHPDDKTERVVMLIAGGGDKPANPQARLDGDRLNVSWSW